MTLDKTVKRVYRLIEKRLMLKKIRGERYSSQWGEVTISRHERYIWVELRGQRVIIVPEEREDLTEYVEEAMGELIPCDIVKGSIQYKMF